MNSLLSVRALLHRGLAGLLLLALPLAAQTAPKPAPAPTPPPAANPADAADIAWHDVTSWGVEGRMIAKYNFTPLSAEKTAQLAKKLGHDSVRGSLTLADIFEYDKREFKNAVKKAVGFN